MGNTIVGTVELIAKIDTGDYVKGAKQVDDANTKIGDSVNNTDNKLLSLGKKGFKIAAAGALGLATAIAAMTIKGGISRALNIEDAQAKLKGLGHDATSVKNIMNSALDSVRGTAYGLDAAATLAATAVAAGVKPGQELTKYLSLAADAATIAGVSIDEMGSVFGKVQTQQRAYTQELNMLADRGIPIYQWLQKELGKTQEELRDMVAAGELDSKTYFKVIQKNIGGAALASGSTTRGAYQNLLAALSRIGQRIVQGPIDKIRGGFGDLTKFLDNNADTIVSVVQTSMQVVTSTIVNTAIALKNLSPVIAAGAAAWVGYRAVIIASSTATYAATAATIAQTTAQKALNFALRANPLGLVVAGITAMVGALVVSNATTNSSTSATDRLNAARKAVTVSTDLLKESEDRLAGAQLNAQGAALAVERAQIQYNEALRQYGPTSLQAREAAYNLKRAEDDLKRANDEVKKSTNEKLVAEKEVAKARNEVIDAEKAKRGQFIDTTLAINGQVTALDKLQQKLKQDYKPSASQKIVDSSVNSMTKLQPEQPTLKKRYMGGSVSAGQAYLVGENRDGSVNDTTELFVPNSSGRIINSKDFQDSLSKVGGSATEYNIGVVNISSEVDGERWLRRLTNNTEIESSGLVPTQKYAW